MKKIVIIIVIAFAFTACGLFHHSGNKNGCPSNGKNVGAEKLVSGDPKATKLAKDAPKFKAGDKFKN